MAPMRLMRAAIPGMRERGWGRIVNVSSTAGKRPSAHDARVLRRQGGAALALEALRRRSTPATASWSTRSARARPSPRCGWRPDGLLDQSRETGGHGSREEALEAARLEAADRPPGRARRDRRRDRLPLLRAGVVRGGRRVESRRRHRPGDHLSAATARRRLAESLLPLDEAAAMDASGSRRRRSPRAALRLARGPGPGLHRAPARPPPACRRDLVPRRPPRRGRELPRARRSARPRRRSASTAVGSTSSARCRRSAPSSPTTRSTRSSV